MLLFDIVALALLLVLGAGLVFLRRYARQNREQASLCQRLTLDAATQCHLAEDSLRRSQASLHSLVDNAPLGICRTSIEGDCYETLNSTLREMLGGYSLEEALQLDISKQVWADPKDRGRMLEILQRSFRVKGFETNFRRRDGSTIPVRISGSLARDKENGVEHFEEYVEDMTQQSTLQQQVRQVQKLEAVGRLAGGMAHDFNNILVV